MKKLPMYQCIDDNVRAYVLQERKVTQSIQIGSMRGCVLVRKRHPGKGAGELRRTSRAFKMPYPNQRHPSVTNAKEVPRFQICAEKKRSRKRQPIALVCSC